ncbi:hypothetical protein DPMN_097636 [Dreissena polymorpha]|uniref:Uncharacterized protein n=1 Tax=Dreissena polymorpha TaxID=45954 RepID=A0A9D4R4R1_DREPO|nr:hypothetical protein DPMN_097636 [Dreissena polymorpha]
MGIQLEGVCKRAVKGQSQFVADRLKIFSTIPSPPSVHGMSEPYTRPGRQDEKNQHPHYRNGLVLGSSK